MHLHVTGEGGAIDEIEQGLDPAPMRVEKVLKRLWHGGHLLKGPFPPGTVDESLLSGLELVGEV